MPLYEFAGSDPIDHFHLGRIEPGDVVELDRDPGSPFKATKKKRPAEPVSDAPTTEKEG